nr:MAG TPA: hypothetical protein [Caudoviricetes sp.]
MMCLHTNRRRMFTAYWQRRRVRNFQSLKVRAQEILKALCQSWPLA